MNKNENLVKWGEIRILRKKSPKIVIKEKNMDKSWGKIMPYRGGDDGVAFYITNIFQ